MKDSTPLHGGKELCFGYHQSVRIAQQRLLLNVDTAATVFYTPGPLLDLVVSALNLRNYNDIMGPLDNRQLRELQKALKKIEVVPTHRKDRAKPMNLSTLSADALVQTFQEKDMSIAQYFRERWNIALRYPQLPLVNIGSKKRPTWLPMELCDVAPAQRCANINEGDTAEMLKCANKKPHDRDGKIREKVRETGYENDAYLEAFGMKVGYDMETVNARILEPPTVQYRNVSERPRQGAWNLRDKEFVQGAVLQKWGVVVSAQIHRGLVDNFIRTLCVNAGKCAMVIRNTRPVIVNQADHRALQIEDLMDLCIKKVESQGPPGPAQLLVVIKADACSSQYGDIKRMSDTVLGVPSQCVLAKHVVRATAPYCGNVALKMNMKLMGKNWVLKDPLPLVSTAPTMIIGADVEHPRSGRGSRPGIASVVASMDRYTAKYASRVAVQSARDVGISALPTMLRELFLAFYEHTNGRRPVHLIYYRDGESEGQYVNILTQEMRLIRHACKMMSDDFLPPVTFIMVNKRHHMRAFGGETDRSGNVMPGTVIDTKICDPHRFDFFLYGHAGIQGTSCPAHYTVLHDENQLSADDVQKLTYALCYTFARCTRSVSVVAPVFYAHLAAARARFFLNETSDDNSSTSTSGSNMDMANASSFEFSPVHQNAQNRMFFILVCIRITVVFVSVRSYD